jgi:hypothetical protein
VYFLININVLNACIKKIWINKYNVKSMKYSYENFEK